MSTRNTIYRLLSLSNDARAVSRGPSAVGKRMVRKAAYRGLSRLLRRSGL
jgi:hypothetical protein